MSGGGKPPHTGYSRAATVGMTVIAVLIGGGVLWGSMTRISGAVMAPGMVGVSGKPKTIQHLDGGVIESINVENGSVVKQGDILVEIDDKTLAANLFIYRSRLRDAFVRRQRLLAELADGTELAPPEAGLVSRYQLEHLPEAMEQERSLLNARRTSRLGEIAQLDERIAQFRKQIAGVEGLRASKEQQLTVYGKEREAIEKLVAMSYAAKNQLLTYERAAADLGGQIAEHDAEIGRLNNSISEVEINKLQVEREFREKVVQELDEVDSRIDELMQQVDATGQQLQRTVIRAPVDGIVHELAIYTIGGVIQPGHPIMQIIPQGEHLEVEVNVDVHSVDQVFVGQQAHVRFPAFHQRTTPELEGTVTRVSPASVIDEKSGVSFYRVSLSIADSELAKLGDQALIPGMPVEAVIPTEPRTVLAYLVKPLTDQFVHAFREE